MVNHAKSDALKTQIARQKRDNLMAQAVAHFLAKLLDSDTEEMATAIVTKQNIYLN